MSKQIAKVMNKREKECVQGEARERKEGKKIDHYSVFSLSLGHKKKDEEVILLIAVD